MKPKEFWIIGREVYNCKQEEFQPLAFHSPQVHVIEYSAYEELVKALNRCKEQRDSIGNAFYTGYFTGNSMRNELNKELDKILGE